MACFNRTFVQENMPDVSFEVFLFSVSFWPEKNTNFYTYLDT